MTLLFYLFFGTGSLSEMQYYGNIYVRERMQRRMQKWFPWLILIDVILLINIL